MSEGPKKAGVLGSPIAHSRSPQLHLAAYRALGLHDWTYERIECGAAELPVVVGVVGPPAMRRPNQGVGRTDKVRACGALVGEPQGGELARHGHRNTDPLRSETTDITVVARNSDKAARLVDLGTRVGVATRFCAFDSGGLADAVAAAEVLVSTIPAEVAAGYAGTLAAIPVLLDAIYDPWPTPLAAAVGSAGGRVISGLQMLLHQAFAQVEQFTGLPAPREAMTCALAALD